MSDEKIYTNSQVEQVKYELREDIAVLKNKIKKIEFVTETLKVSDVRYTTNINWIKIKTAYRIEAHISEFANNEYVHPVICHEHIGGINQNKYYVVLPIPTDEKRIVELTDDDTLRVQYMVEKTLE